MRTSTNERIYIGLGFKLTNSMSFDESLFFVRLFQKITTRDLFIKGKFKIKIRHIREKTLEDMRRHRNEAGGEGLPSGVGWPHLQGARLPWGIPSRASRVFFHRLLGYISAVPQVGLIQGLTLGPPRLYKEALAPPEGIKSSNHLEIKPSRARNPNSSEFL
jgi:hypothetical protein